MYVSINKQLIDLRNCFGVLYRLRQGKGQGHVLISKDFTGNITLCRRQYVAPGLQVDHPWCRYWANSRQRNV